MDSMAFFRLTDMTPATKYLTIVIPVNPGLGSGVRFGRKNGFYNRMLSFMQFYNILSIEFH